MVGFTLAPYDTTARHGVEAFTCSGVSVPGYGTRETPPAPRPPGAGGGREEPEGLARRLRRAAALVPGAAAARRAARLAVAELRHLRASAARIRGFDAVVVAGGGQLDGFWGGPFGHPWTLWRWARLARAEGIPFVVLSVGTGTIPGASGRFVRGALRLAAYRSYRDARSRELVRAPDLTAADPVVPDLAYGLPLAAAPHVRSRTVGVSPMAYADPRVWPAPDRARYRAHVDGLADLCVRLVGAGHDVELFSSNGSDAAPLEELRAAAAARLEPAGRARLRVSPAAGVQGLMALLGRCDVVVAARLHGVLLGHVAGRPALAISHERKVRTLMQDMGHERYCLEIDGFSPAVAWERFLELEGRLDELAADVAAKVSGCRARVEDQYDRIFGVEGGRR